jgi:hypothetical protein
VLDGVDNLGDIVSAYTTRKFVAAEAARGGQIRFTSETVEKILILAFALCRRTSVSKGRERLQEDSFSHG